MRLFLAISLLGTLVLAGCGENDPFNTEQPRRGPAMGVGGALAPVDLDVQGNGAKTPPPPPPPANDSTNTTKTGTPPPPPPPPQKTTNTTSGEPTPPAVDPNVDRVEAGVGIETKKGHGYGTGPIATPVSAYFSMREQIALNQVAQGLQHFKALNGRAPKTNEEFMEKVVKEGGIQLPQLRTDEHRYVFDPETETLMIEQPRR